jgi:hypothetical protein
MAAANTGERSSRPTDGEVARLWLPALAPAFAWIAAFMLNVVLTPWICSTGQRWVVFAVTGLALVAAAAGGLGSFRTWKELEEQRETPLRSRKHFMAGGGVLLAAVFLIAILAMAISAVIHRPCD